MTIGEIRISLSKLSRDFDDTHVMLHSITDDGKPVWDLLTFVAHTKDFSAFVLGGWSVTKQLAKDGKLSVEQELQIREIEKQEEDLKNKKKETDENDDTELGP